MSARRVFLTLEEAGEKPCVYFIEAHGLVKIGMSVHLPSRFKELGRTIPCPIRLIAAIEREHVSEVRQLETQYHLLFSGYRRHGEWFDLPAGWLDLVGDERTMLPAACFRLDRGGKGYSVPLTWLYHYRAAA